MIKALLLKCIRWHDHNQSLLPPWKLSCCSDESSESYPLDLAQLICPTFFLAISLSHLFSFWQKLDLHLFIKFGDYSSSYKDTLERKEITIKSLGTSPGLPRRCRPEHTAWSRPPPWRRYTVFFVAVLSSTADPTCIMNAERPGQRRWPLTITSPGAEESDASKTDRHQSLDDESPRRGTEGSRILF